VNVELTSLDPDLERTLRRARRAQAEMGDNPREPRVEQHEEIGGKRKKRTRKMKMREMGTGVCTSWISRLHYMNC
jgi:hypothetical protein